MNELLCNGTRIARDFGLQSLQLMSGKSFWIQEHIKTQSGEESSSSGHFNPVGCLQQSVMRVLISEFDPQNDSFVHVYITDGVAMTQQINCKLLFQRTKAAAGVIVSIDIKSITFVTIILLCNRAHCHVHTLKNSLYNITVETSNRFNPLAYFSCNCPCRC